jgi:uncharacterized membrane protein
MTTAALPEGIARPALLLYVQRRLWSSVVYTAVVSWTAILFLATRAAYENFRYGRFDLGNMVQAVWSTAHGRPLETTMGTTGEQLPRLAGHVDPILVLLTPAWIVAPTPLTLAAVQIAACAAGALPVFWLARKHLHNEATAAVLAVTYLAYPWLAWIAVEAMHPITLAVPLILYAIWYLDEDRMWQFVVFAILAVLCGELVGATIALFGLWVAVNQRRKIGAAIAASGALWTATCLYVITPAFAGQQSMFYDLYTGVGSSPQRVAATLATHPGQIASRLVTEGDVRYLLYIIVPTAGLCLLSGGLVLAATPQLLANGLSSQGTAIDPRLHLVSTVVPFVIAATVYGTRRLPARAQLTAAVAALAMCLGVSAAVGPWSGAAHNRWIGGQPSSAHLQAVRTGIALVPDNVALTTTNRAGAYLSDRRVIYSAPIVRDAKWVFLDLRDPWVPTRGQHTWGSVDDTDLRFLRRRLSKNPSWQAVFATDGVFVFRRAPSPASS